MTRGLILAVALAACGHGAAPAPAAATPPIANAAPPDAPPADEALTDSIGGSGAPAAELSVEIEAAKDSGRAQVGNGHGPRVVDPPPPAIDDGPAARISVGGVQALDESSLTPDEVAAKIVGAYASGLKRCYENALKRDPTLRGKVVVELTVNETGRATHPKVTGFDDGVSACFLARAESWRFDQPKTADGDVTTAGFAFTFQLVPQ